MSEDEVAAVLRELREVKACLGELRAQVGSMALWQKTREQAEHDAVVYRAGQASIVRFALALWKSDIAKFVGALLIAGAGTKVL